MRACRSDRLNFIAIGLPLAFTVTIPVRTAAEERAVIRWERENERRFHAHPGALLRLYRGAPDAALTARRYAVEIEQRGTQ